MKFKKILYLFIPLFIALPVQAEEDQKRSCSSKFFNNDDSWRDCYYEKLHVAADEFESKLMTDITSALILAFADSIVDEGFKKTIVGKAVFGEPDKVLIALQKMTKKIIYEINQSEERVISAINESFEKREFQSMKSLMEQVESYMLLNNETKLLVSRQVELGRMISEFNLLSYNFLIHRNVDVSAYVKIKSIEMMLRTFRITSEQNQLGNQSEISRLIKLENNLILGSTYQELEVLYDVIYRNWENDFLNESYISDSGLNGLEIRYDQNWYCSLHSPGTYSNVNYFLSNDIGEYINIKTACSGRLDVYGSCIMRLDGDLNSSLYKKYISNITKYFGEGYDLVSAYYENPFKYSNIDSLLDSDIAFDRYPGNNNSRCVARNTIETKFNRKDKAFENLIGEKNDIINPIRFLWEYKTLVSINKNKNFYSFKELQILSNISDYDFISKFNNDYFLIYERDIDGDGLRYFEEIKNNSSDFSSDSDSDGFTDALELRCSSDPSVKENLKPSNYFSRHDCNFITDYQGEFEHPRQPADKNIDITIPPGFGYAYWLDINGSCPSGLHDDSDARLFVDPNRVEDISVYISNNLTRPDLNGRYKNFNGGIRSIQIFNNSEESINISGKVTFGCTD
jgi:hypothetical protein